MRRLADHHPAAVTAYFLAVAGIAMFSMDPVILMLSLLGSIICYCFQDGLRNPSIHFYLLGLFVIMTAINPIVSHNGETVLFVMNHRPITLEAIIYGAFAAMMVVSVFYWFRSFTVIMTSDKLLYIFGRLSSGAALMLSMTLRYIPLFGDQIKRVNHTQKALGLYKEDNVVDSVRGGIRVFSVMVTWTLENGIITADSMASRGYGTGKRTHFSLFKWKKGDMLLLTASMLLAIATLYFGRTSEYTYYPSFSFPCHMGSVGYAAYAMLAFIPLFIDVKESVKWRIFMSKI